MEKNQAATLPSLIPCYYGTAASFGTNFSFNTTAHRRRAMIQVHSVLHRLEFVVHWVERSPVIKDNFFLNLQHKRPPEETHTHACMHTRKHTHTHTLKCNASSRAWVRKMTSSQVLQCLSNPAAITCFSALGEDQRWQQHAIRHRQ